MQHVTEELNPTRSTQISAGVPLHESVKIALGTLLSVSPYVAHSASSLSFFLYKTNFPPCGFQVTPQLLSASRRVNMAMDELAKANHSVMKMGGDAVA